MSEEIWLKQKAACKILGCEKSYFYVLIHEKALVSKLSGKKKGYEVTRSSCEAWVLDWENRIN